MEIIILKVLENMIINRMGLRPVVIYMKIADEVKTALMNSEKVNDGVKLFREKSEFIRKLETEAYKEKSRKNRKERT